MQARERGMKRTAETERGRGKGKEGPRARARRTPECGLRVFQNVELRNAATDSAVLAGFVAVRGHARGKHISSSRRRRRRRRSNSSSS
jgi:hypothetical protein